MKKAGKKSTNVLEILLSVFVFVVFVLALFFEGKGINLVTEWFTKIFISLVYSLVAGALVGTFTGDLLDGFNFKIGWFRINLPVMILTFLVKIWLF